MEEPEGKLKPLSHKVSERLHGLGIGAIGGQSQ